MNSEKVIYGALAGLATGLILGLLFAPDKGSNTREMIARKGQDYTGNLKNKFNDVLGKADDRLNEAKEGAKDLLDKGKSAAQQVKKETAQTLKSGQSYQA